MTIAYLWARALKKISGAAITNSSIHKTSKVEAGSQIVDSTMGKYSYCGYNCEILHCDIGSFCSIANNVAIGGAKHPIEWVSMSPVFYSGRDSIRKKFAKFQRETSKRTIIGSDVWIGHGAHIKQGVTIGNGAIIGMGAVVTKDVVPYSIVAGNPAKFIRYRFDEIVIEELLKSEWWDMPDEKISQLAQYIQSPKEFINHL